MNIAANKHRDPMMDGLKLVAAGGIVMVHVSMQYANIAYPRLPHQASLTALLSFVLHAFNAALPRFTEQVAYSALYFFFVVAGYFHGALGTRGLTWLRKRMMRLAVPYFIWSLVFVGWWTIFHFIRHWPHPWYFPDPIRFLFFAGAAEVLWSLPWLFVCAVIAEMFVRTPWLRRTLMIVAVLVQLAVWIWLPQSAIPNYGVRQYIAGARWVFMYLAGMELRAAQSVKGSPRVWTITALVASVAAGAIAVVLGAQPTDALPSVILFCLNGGVALSLLAGARVGAKWFGAGRLAWGGHYLLGIYVSHGLWLAILARLFLATSVPSRVWLPLGWGVVFGLSVFVTHALLASRWTRLTVT